jgi:hypothetical protein
MEGCVWGKESDWVEVNKAARKDGFTQNPLDYMGNILTYDTGKVYALFRNQDTNENFLVAI